MEGLSSLYISRTGSLARSLQDAEVRRSATYTTTELVGSFSLLIFWTGLIFTYSVLALYILNEIGAPIPESFIPLVEYIKSLV